MTGIKRSIKFWQIPWIRESHRCHDTGGQKGTYWWSSVSGLGVKICYVSMPYTSLWWVLNQVWQKQQTFLLWLLSAFLWPSFSSIKRRNCIYPIGKLWRLNTTLYSAWHQEKGSFPSSSLVQTSSKYCNNSEGKYHCGISEGKFQRDHGACKGRWMHSGMCSGKAGLRRGTHRWTTSQFLIH